MNLANHLVLYYEKKLNDIVENVSAIKVAKGKVKRVHLEEGCKCLCKQYNLIWGNKVSCEFRKKVVEIAKRLGKDPNLLMAGMALETGTTFSPTAGKGSSYVGLIQFGKDAAKAIGTTQEKLLKMNDIEQLDYVEKYLEKNKDKINSLTDFYLSILMPVDVGKGNQKDFVVFDNQYPLVYKNGKPTDLSKSRRFGYRKNPLFLCEGELLKNIEITRSNGKKIKVSEIYEEKKRWYEGGETNYEGEGKTYIWEIEKSISHIFEEGKKHKAKTFNCNCFEENNLSFEPNTWNVVITEQYTGEECTHSERTPKRKNCRRGKIDIFDHNNSIVLSITDCLLEGIGGENRLIKNSDTPFGTYQISNTGTFISSNSTNIDSYGPNPRLVFEPIKGKGDEADRSGRSAIRIHGGRQEGTSNPTLKRTQGCIRVWDSDAKRLYDWWVEFKKHNPTVKAGKVIVKK
ncbi:L,D-transpeptidase [Capnocytophaga catalasegens]|uniref:L,D-TPase catalytic domain-containing protein n=1 Tax=Capnocytophaga catalasegens TaxID=1004260 RepID=A0ABQ4VNC4_9FLAO|nr:L,D-transpeptidase [Capnocytophaga catalasegens]GJM53353.1 hypothetical protein RCZ16_16700 [Capnocytophaga catalasegens]